MSKKTYYFSHDSNARNDEKILAVRMRHKAEGYGAYFMILERLMESTNYTSIKDYNIIAFDLRVGAELVKSIVEDFNLFIISEDGKSFYSNSFMERMEPLDNMRKQRVEAGKKSAAKRIENQQKLNKSETTVKRPLNENPTKESKVKESKVKESRNENILFSETQKESFNKFLKFIKDKASNVSRMKEPFTIAEFLKLKEIYSTEQISDMLLKMHNYKPLLTKNNSAYLTFLNWQKRDNQSAIPEGRTENYSERLKAAFNDTTA